METNDKARLTIKELAPYLPYGLVMADSISTMWDLTTSNTDHALIYWRPMLRPLSDLNEIITHRGEKIHPIETLLYTYHTHDIDAIFSLIQNDNHQWVNHLEYFLFTHLLEWHFDVFGLIPKGLAIDINQLS